MSCAGMLHYAIGFAIYLSVWKRAKRPIFIVNIYIFCGVLTHFFAYLVPNWELICPNYNILQYLLTFIMLIGIVLRISQNDIH